MESSRFRNSACLNCCNSLENDFINCGGDESEIVSSFKASFIVDKLLRIVKMILQISRFEQQKLEINFLFYTVLPHILHYQFSANQLFLIDSLDHEKFIFNLILFFFYVATFCSILQAFEILALLFQILQYSGNSRKYVILSYCFVCKHKHSNFNPNTSVFAIQSQSKANRNQVSSSFGYLLGF